jgi:outer membrane protein assembly factor BamB
MYLVIEIRGSKQGEGNIKKVASSIFAFAFIALMSIASSAFALYPTSIPWSMCGFDAKHAASTTSTAPSNNMTLWQHLAQMGSGYSRQAIPIVVDGMVIFHDGNYAHAVDETTGVELWVSEFLAGGYGGLWPSIAYGDGRVYFHSSDYIYGNGYIFCLNASTGEKLWTYDPNPNGRVEAAITFDAGVVYFGTLNNYLYAINATTGHFLWRYQTGGQILSSPAVENDLVCVGSDDGKVYALNFSGSTPVSKWNFTADNVVRSPITIYGNYVFFGTNNATFYAVDKETSASIWSYHLNSGTFEKGFAVGNNVIYVPQWWSSWKLLALRVDTPTGNYTEADPEPRLWVKTGPTGWSEPILADNKVFVSTNVPNMLYALNVDSGEAVWTSSFSGTPSSPVIADGRVFVTVSDNLGVFCLGNPFPPVTNVYRVIAGGTSFDVPIVTNSTVTNFNATSLETEKKISFEVAGINETTGMCNITLPNDMLDGALNVTVDGEQPLYSDPPLNNGTHTSLYFNYNNTFPHTIEIVGTTVIPEFPVTALPLVITAFFMATIKFHKKRNK